MYHYSKSFSLENRWVVNHSRTFFCVVLFNGKVCCKFSLSVFNSDLLVHDQFVEHVNNSDLCQELKGLVHKDPGLTLGRSYSVGTEKWTN